MIVSLAYVNFDTLHRELLASRLIPLLSKDQQQKADTYRHEIDRTRYILRQGILLTLLAEKLNTAPDKIQLEYTEYKKPYITTNPPLYFNMSFSHDRLAILLDDEGPCGVDIETIKQPTPPHLLTSEALSLSEQRIFQSLSEPEQTIAFYNSWTLKEAYLKAVGTGLHRSPQSISFPVISTPPEMLPDWSNELDCGDYYLYSTQPEQGFIIAMALKKRPSIKINNIDVGKFYFTNLRNGFTFLSSSE